MYSHHPTAVAVLAHFCENHGPRIVMSTQMMMSVDPESHATNYAEKLRRQHPQYGTKRWSKIPFYRLAALAMGSPDRVFVTSSMRCFAPPDTRQSQEAVVFSEWDRKHELVDEDQRCPACSSLGPEAVHVANDYRMRKSFMSSETILNEECYMTVKAAVNRIMFSERLDPASPNASPEDEGFLVFGGANEDYHAIVRTFCVNDAKSRGFRRRYLFMVLSQDQQLIFSSAERVKQDLDFSVMIIQMSANRVYRMEKQVDKEKMIKKARYMPRDVFQSKIVIDTTRSLSVLCNEKNIWAFLHRDLVGLLQEMLHPAAAHIRPPLSMKPESTLSFTEGVVGFAALRTHLDRPTLLVIVDRVVHGKQVVVRSSAAKPRAQVIYALANFVPANCTTAVFASPAYRTGREVSILGVAAEIDVPDTVALIDLIVSNGAVSNNAMNYKLVVTMPSSENGNSRAPGTIVAKYASSLNDIPPYFPSKIHFMSVTTIRKAFEFEVQRFSQCANKWSGPAQKSNDFEGVLVRCGFTINDIPAVSYWSTTSALANGVTRPAVTVPTVGCLLPEDIAFRRLRNLRNKMLEDSGSLMKGRAKGV